MKSYKVPAEVFAILKKLLVSLDTLSKERDNEIDEALEEFTERKFAKIQQIKKKYNLKIKLAEKSTAAKTAHNNVDSLKQMLKDELKRAET